MVRGRKREKGEMFDARSSLVSRTHPGYCTLEPFSRAPKCPSLSLSGLTNSPNVHIYILIPRSLVTPSSLFFFFATTQKKKKQKNWACFFLLSRRVQLLFLAHSFNPQYLRDTRGSDLKMTRPRGGLKAGRDYRHARLWSMRGQIISRLSKQRRPIKGF